MEKIKIVQIGVTHEHADGKMYALKKLPDVFDLVGYVDDREFSTTPRTYSRDYVTPYEGVPQLSLEEALNYPGLQATVVEVPNNELVPIALRCMERNLAMHMDKPAGEDLDLYKELLDGCAARNLPFQMGFMFRGNPAFQFCISAIRQKWLGEIFQLEADMNHSYGNDDYHEYVGKFPGGLMYILGCHLIDFVISALGCPEKVIPILKSAPGMPNHIKNNCTAILEYPNAVAILKSCSREIGCTAQRRIKIAGTNGSISFSPLERFDGQPVELTLQLREAAGNLPAGKHLLCFPMPEDRYTEQLRELAAMIKGECKSSYTYQHDYLVHHITLISSGINDPNTLRR